MSEAIGNAGACYLPIVTKACTTRVRVSDVMMITRNNRKLEIVAESGEFQYYEKLDNVTKCLGEGFYRCSDGIIMNFEKVECMKHQGVTFSNGTHVDMGRDAYLRTRKAFTEYLQEQYRKHLI